MNSCQTCINWKFAYDDYPDKWGICNNSDFTDRIRIAEDSEDLSIFTESCNGCNWYEGRELVVAKIDLPKK